MNREEMNDLNGLLHESATMEKIDMLIDTMTEHCIYQFTTGKADMPYPDEVKALADLIRARNEAWEVGMAFRREVSALADMIRERKISE